MPGIPNEACYQQNYITKRTILNRLTEGSPERVMLESIPDANWSITSYNARSSVACIEVNTGVCINVLSIKVPMPVVNNRF